MFLRALLNLKSSSTVSVDILLSDSQSVENSSPSITWLFGSATLNRWV